MFQAHVQPDKIGKFQRAHGMVIAEFHRLMMSGALATPCSNILIASSPSATPNRLEANPGTSFTTIGSFFKRRPTARTVSTVCRWFVTNHDFNQTH